MGAFEDLFGEADHPQRHEGGGAVWTHKQIAPAPPQLKLEVSIAPAPPPAVAERFEFFVHGEPKGKGSKRAFVITPKGGGKPRAIITDVPNKGTVDKLISWENAVTSAALQAFGDRERITAPVVLVLTFYLERPASHFRTNGALKPSAPRHHSTKPDGDKLMRATVDALKAAMLRDDSIAWDKRVRKLFVGDDGTRGPGCRIVVEVTP